MDRTIDDEDCGMQIVRSSLHTGQILMEVLRWLDECKVFSNFTHINKEPW